MLLDKDKKKLCYAYYSCLKRKDTRGSKLFQEVISDWNGKVSMWEGFQRFDFQVAGRACFVVVPKQPKAGNPWVWKAKFPRYHIEPDKLLLERGFHVTYINCGNMMGCPKALEYWDKFYEYMTKQHGMSKKVCLEAISRGGLPAYRW